MKKQILSTLTCLALCLSLLHGTAWAAPRDIHLASGNSITQLDPAPTTPTDDPFPTLQSFVHFIYYSNIDSVPAVGNALTGATGDEASFAWDAKQNGHYGTITLNADGTYSYKLDNDNYTVETLQFGQTLTEEFTYTYTDSNSGAADGSINIYLPGTGRKVANPKLVLRPDADTFISSDSTQPAKGNVFDGLRDLYPDFQGNASNDHNFAWDADQEATFGTITLESNGDYSYTLNNDHPHVKALPYINALGPGQNLIEEFEFKFTKTAEVITDEPSEVGDVISGWLIVTIEAGGESAGDEPQPGDAANHHEDWSELTSSSDILVGNSYYLNGDVTYTGTAPIRAFGDITLCLNGHTLDLNGEYIYLCNGASLTLCDCAAEEGDRGGSITGGSATHGAVYVDDGGTFDMTGGAIANSSGRGVYVKGTFNMTGGSISGSTADYGGGAYVNGGIFNMEGGTISDNTADSGGGVCVTGSGSFNMEGGTISDNTADYGGGVCVNSGSFHMSDTASITDNTADYGGGVYLPNTGSFTMENGEILGNTADANGGGVYVNGGTFKMENGEIADNTADYGGGVFAAGDFALKAGEIAGNTADYGSAVYMYDGTFTLTDGTLSSIYLYDEKTITIDGALSDTQKIGVTMRTPGVFTSGWTDYMGGKDPADYFTSESPAYIMVLGGNEAALERLYTVTFVPNGGNGTMETQYFSNGEVKALTANAFTCPGYIFTRWNTQADGSGTSYGDRAELTVTNDLTLYAQWTAIPSDGGSSDPTYSVTLPGRVEGGTVTAAKRYAEEGETFRFTVTPDEGYKLGILTVTDSKGKEIDLIHKGGNEYTFEMPARSVTVTAEFVREGVQKLPFTDVPEGAWYEDAAAYVYEHGLMAGTSTTTFAPNATTSRSMIAAILWRMAGSPVVNYLMTFSDVEQGQWYSETIRWAASETIITGYDNGAFGTNDPITREQFAVMLYRFAQEQGYDVSVGENTNILSYTDVADLSEYAISAMQWAVGTGIITGTGDGSTLSPQGQATRAEAAVMLMRFCEAYVIW